MQHSEYPTEFEQLPWYHTRNAIKLYTHLEKWLSLVTYLIWLKIKKYTTWCASICLPNSSKLFSAYVLRRDILDSKHLLISQTFKKDKVVWKCKVLCFQWQKIKVIFVRDTGYILGGAGFTRLVQVAFMHFKSLPSATTWITEVWMKLKHSPPSILFLRYTILSITCALGHSFKRKTSIKW